MTEITITLPGVVWEDYLDPLTTGMQAELELPEPRYRRMGKGSQRIYEDVGTEVAVELADYLESRAFLILNQDDDGQGHVHRSAIKAAGRIRREVRS